MIRTLYDTGDDYQITAKMDGACYQVATEDCVVGGVGNEFQFTQNGLNITFQSGSEAVIGGAFFKVMDATTIPLDASTTVYLCATIDLSLENGGYGVFTQRTSSNMQHENLNGAGIKRDLLLYTITTGANSIENIVDNRNIVSRKKRIYHGTSNPSNSLGENGDLYFKHS